MRQIAAAAACAALLIGLCAPAMAYPLFGSDDRNMPRLVKYREEVEQVRGARLPLEAVDLRLTKRADLALPAADDPDFRQQVLALLPPEDVGNYCFAVLDLTDLNRPRYAEHRGDVPQFPGSVGKVVVALGMFQALADAYPDTAKRFQVLRDTMVTADQFILVDDHEIPIVENGELDWRMMRQGDTGNLYSWMDWMLSASSNSAGAMVQKEAMILRKLGGGYAAGRAGFDLMSLPSGQRGALYSRTFMDVVPQNGLNPAGIRQGSFFTSRGKALVPGPGGSSVTARELTRYLLLMEQGRLVDEWSSREIKRLLYLTQKRIRYASSPALNNAALYFKSGSLYQCRPEPGFGCEKYKGNKTNMLNSVAIVEHPAEGRKLYYYCVLLSNVLRKNSAVEHQTFGTRLQRLMERLHPEAADK